MLATAKQCTGMLLVARGMRRDGEGLHTLQLWTLWPGYHWEEGGELVGLRERVDLDVGRVSVVNLWGELADMELGSKQFLHYGQGRDRLRQVPSCAVNNL